MPTRERIPRLVLAVVLLTVAGTAFGDSPDFERALERLATYRFGESRDALTVIAEHVDRASGDREAAGSLATRLAEMLGDDIPVDAKRFVCRQLAMIGGEESVPQLATLLGGDELGGHAVYALQPNPSAAAGRALIDRLDGPADAVPIGVINAIGARGDEDAVTALSRVAAADHDAAARAAIAALGRIGGEAAADALTAIAKVTDGDERRRDTVDDALLQCAERLIAEGAPRRAALLAGLVLERTNDEQRRMGAFRFLAENGVVQNVVRALLDEEAPVWHGFAMDLARTTGGTDSTLGMAHLIGRLPESQALMLIEALGDRGDPAAVPGLLEAAADGHADTRQTAIRALGRAGDAAAVGPLLAIADDDGEDAADARDSLRRLRGADVDDTIAALLETSSPAGRIELLRALADRGAARTDAVIASARHDDAAVRHAALETLAAIGRDEDLGAAVYLVVLPTADADRDAARDAAISIGLRMPDVARRSGPVIDALPDATVPSQRTLLAVLGRLGGERSLGVVRSALLVAALHDAAVAALASWPDASAAPDLLTIATEPRDAAVHATAVAGYARLASFAPTDLEAVAMLDRAMTLASTTAERRGVLAEVAGVRHPGAMAIAASRLDDADLTDAASEAVVTIAGGLDPPHRDAARAAIALALSRHQTPVLRERAGAALDRLEADEDYVTAWRAAGPYDGEDLGPTDLFDLVMAPERNGDDPAVVWSLLGESDDGVFDLDHAIGGGNRCAYVTTLLHADRARKIRLDLGSDDGIKVWVNGEVTHANNALRGLTRGEDRVVASLAAGWNTLLLKITQGGGDWSFACRIRDPLGFHAEGVRGATRMELAEPPDDAHRLIADGHDAWTHANGDAVAWDRSGDELVCRPGSGSIVTRRSFGDAIVHVEFMIPEGLGGAGQSRGNSGVYVQGRYEVQILESTGDDPVTDGCGAIYGRHAPRLNVAAPPGTWQRYVIDFTAPWYDGEGTKVRNARMSVWHNGVLVHDDVEIAGHTGAGNAEAPGAGPLLLQDHGHPIRFRNVWVRPKPATWEGADATGFVPLFDGSTLDGWRRLGGAADYRVDDGAIVGSTRPDQPNSFLCTVAEYDDFVLELEFRVDGELNSGIQIRSLSTPDHEDGRVHGYQVEIDPSDRAWSAGIYDEGRRGWLDPLDDNEPARRAFRPDEWNRLRIEARGDRIRTWLNGVPAANLTDAMTPSGFIGLQVHGVGDRKDPLEVRWRDVRIKELERDES